MPDYSEFVPNVHFEQIPIKDLVSNQDYQRNLSLGHINRAAENFDLYQINPVKVSRRDGVNYVFNGQHTIEIVALVSGSRETPVWCMIYDDLSYTAEANILNAVAKLISVFGDGLNDDIFKEKLGAVSVKQLTRVAKERKSGCMGFAETMIIEYNGKKKSRANRLSMGRLYSKGYSGDIGEEDDEDDPLQDESESEYPVIE